MPLVSSGRVGSGNGQITFSNSNNSASTSTTTSAASSALQQTITVTGLNLGVGSSLFAGSTGTGSPVLQFKTILAGAGIVLSENAESITLSSTAGVASSTFVGLTDGPGIITPNALVIGATVNGSSKLQFTPAPTAANQILTWTGSAFEWGNAPTDGTVTSVAVAPGTGIAVTGSPVTTSGTITVGLAASGVAAGTYAVPTITVDATGRVINAVTGTLGNIVNAVSTVGSGSTLTTGIANGVLSLKSISAGNGVSLTTGADGSLVISANSGISIAATGSNGVVVTGSPITSIGTLAIALAASGVTPGTYNSVVVDVTGRVTSASNVSGIGSITALGGTGITVANGQINSSGTFTISLSASGVTAGSYGQFVVDSTGRLTFARALTASDITTALGYTPTNASASGTVTSVAGAGGTGITVTGGPITGSGTLTVSLIASGVVAGTYSNLSIDATGRVIAARALNATDISSALGYTPASTTSSGTVTSIAASGGNGIAVSGSPITTAGTLSITLLASGVTAGTYGNFVVDQTGRLTSARMLSSSDITTALGYAPATGSVTSVAAVGDPNITVSGSPITTAGTFAIALTTTGVGPGSYANLYIDSYGRVTNARLLDATDIENALGFIPASAAASGTVTSVAATSADGSITIGGSPITSSGTFTFAVAASGVTAGTYTNFVVDSTGRLVSARNISSSDITNALGYTPASSTASGTVTSVSAVSDGSITIVGSPITTAGTLTLSLAATGVTPGSYTNFVVDSAGRLSSARNLSASDISTALGYTPAASGSAGTGTVTDVAAVGLNGIDITGSPVTSSGTFSISLSLTGVTSGTYSNLTIDSTGRVTAARAISASDITTALGYTPASSSGAGSGTVTEVAATSDGSITITGSPITSAGTLSIAVAASGVAAGSYNNFVVDATGRLTYARPLDSTDITTALGYTPSSGTVTDVALVADSNFVVYGSPITTSGTLSIQLTGTTVIAGTYNGLVIDAYGRITSARDLDSADVTTALGFTPGQVNLVAATGDNAITVTGSPITTAGTLAISLAATGVAAGTYDAATVVVDSQGRVTSASSNSFVSSITAAAGAGISIANGLITTAGTFTVSLTASGVAAGTYTSANIVVDQYGRVLSAADGTGASGTFAPITIDGLDGITVTGSPVASGGTVNIGLATTGVTAGSYSFASLSTDAYGRILTIESSTVTGDGNVLVAGAYGQIALSLSTTGVMPGSYTKVYVDDYGRITQGGALTSSDITNALGYTPASSSGGSSGTYTLPNSGVVAGTYNNAIIVVDSQGIITSAVTNGNVPQTYNFQVNFDSSGNINTTTPYTGLPPNWTFTLDSNVQFTITHDLYRMPQSVIFYGQSQGNFNMKTPIGNQPSQFSVGFPSASGTQPATFTCFAVTATSTDSDVSSYAVCQVLI